MDLAMISEDRAEARKRFLEYRRSVRERHSEEDAQIMRGYRELARGRQLIRLSETVTAGGTTSVDVPRLVWREQRQVQVVETVIVPRIAVCRADVPVIWTEGVTSQGQVEILMRRPREIGSRNRRDRVMFGGFAPVLGARSWSYVRAIVPSVPPPFRPAHHLRNYSVLFEAEWAPDPQAPVDPALLKHIGGDLYAVLAVWELTELERAVLSGRTFVRGARA